MKENNPARNATKNDTLGVKKECIYKLPPNCILIIIYYIF